MKQRISLARGQEIGERVIDALMPYCSMACVAGSIRRRKPIVGDVDIVAVPLPDENEQLLAAFRSLGVCEGKGKVVLSATIEGVQVDLWLVPAASWGAAILFATGSAQENIRLRAVAKRSGWKLSQYDLSDVATGQIIASETEESIYEELGLSFLRPEQRE